MSTLNVLEKAVLERLLAGDHEILVALRAQARHMRINSRKQTGAGFYCNFEVPAEISPINGPQNFELDDVDASIDGLEYGAGFLLFVRNGRMSFLEGYSYEEPWPTEVKNFRLSYRTEPRELPTSWPVEAASETVLEHQIVAQTPEQLQLVTDAVHDCWFEIDAVRMIDSNTLEIPVRCTSGHFFASARDSADSPTNLLRIHEVESFDIRDTQKVGSYNCNELKFNSIRKQITITTGIPLDFLIQVKRLRVTVTQP